MRSIKNILALSLKELRSLFGDTVLVALIVFAFTFLVHSAATGVSNDVKNAAVGVIDADRSPLSRQITAALLPPHFQTPVAVSREEVDALMDKGKLVFVIEFPPNFQRDVEQGREPQVQLLTDATTIAQAGLGQSYIGQIFQNELIEFLGQRDLIDQLMPVKPVIKMQFNPNGSDVWPLAIMEVDNMITMITLVLVGAAVIRERERGTIEHLLVMPVGASEIVLSKILANGLVICTVALLSMRWLVGGLLEVPLAGSLWLFALGAAVFMFSIASLAVMLATLAPTMPQYSLLMMPVYIIALMFSGSSSPRNNMPEAAQWISEYWPTTQFVSLAQNVLLRGAGIDLVWPQLAAMSAAGALFLGYALFRFRKMLEQQG
ncbi:ABC transporter permease [Neisseria sp.]|uniref:ABC transporter permease n=1 Tax=Neisseria sp. TaxID=192066 RepID=UPI0026DB7DDA|nr:ABC transporter permease [Neisseria sp.]MDO4228040.1 ABC transporter permease [Neisseria sp.]